MARILLTLRYDGTAYHGWQVQPNGVTVQQVVQDAVEAVTGVRAGVTGCSRTDAGVHADMFCCAIDSETALRGDKLCSALNFHLPRDVSVYDAREVEEEFHPRYHAKGKRYVYRIWNGNQRHPMYEKYAIWLKKPLDVDALNAIVQDYVGTHDFAAFCGAGSDLQGTTERTIHSCTVTRQGDLVLFTVEGDGFLYNMVRIMVGTLLEIAAGRIPADGIPAILEGRDRNAAGPTAPAQALCLEQVFYD